MKGEELRNKKKRSRPNSRMSEMNFSNYSKITSPLSGRS
jgi:hypothetical protein